MIKIENLCKEYQDFKIDHINLEVNKGEYFVVLGPSGSGKTLLLEMIAGLINPDSGSIRGVHHSHIGLIYQDYMLFPHMDVFRNIGYGLRIKKTGKDEINNIVRSTAQELDIAHLLHRRIDHLSGGERQRVAIARTMVLEPEIYLFDEPTAALDISTRIKIQRLFMRLHKEHQPTVIHVTHDFEEALALGDRVALLFDGRMVQIDTPEKVFNDPVTKTAADFLGYKNVLSGKIKDYRMNIDGVEIMTMVPQSDLAYIAIRASDIILSKEKILSSARNSFQGEVLRVIQRENYIEVVFDVGILLHVNITSLSRQELAVKPGQRLWATFKTVAVKVFEH